MDNFLGENAPVGVRRIGSLDVEIETTAGVLARIGDAVAERRSEIWGFCNAHTVNLAAARPDFERALRNLTLVNDGFGLDIASRWIYGSPFPENLNGTDLTPKLLRALPKGTTIFLVGGRPDVLRKAEYFLRHEYPNITISGSHHGYFSLDEGDSVAAMIAAQRPALVIVGMGQPRQETWAARYHLLVPAPILCVGALIDRWSGRVPRAPLWMRRLRAEWIFRLFLEPRRLARRYISGNLVFLYRVWRQRRVFRSNMRIHHG